MEPFTISFFGHRRIENLVSVESKLIRIVRDLLKSKTYVEFLVGRNGDFDQLVSSVVRRAKREYRADNSSLVLVLPYVTTECRDNEESFLEYYDEVEICEESAFAHFKSAIRIRNCSMIEKSDLVVCYVEHSSGGAYQAMKYAKKHHKQIYNLCTFDESGENT